MFAKRLTLAAIGLVLSIPAAHSCGLNRRQWRPRCYLDRSGCWQFRRIDVLHGRGACRSNRPIAQCAGEILHQRPQRRLPAWRGARTIVLNEFASPAEKQVNGAGISHMAVSRPISEATRF